MQVGHPGSFVPTEYAGRPDHERKPEGGQKKATHLAVLAITGVAFFVRLVSLDYQSLWRDEVDSRWFADAPYPELLRQLFAEGQNGFLYFTFLRPWITLTGASEYALRFPSAVAGTLAVPAGYVLARQLGFGRRVGVMLALLLATSPYLVWYSQEVKMYAIFLLVVVVALIAYLKALTGGGARWWVAFVVAVSLSFYLHILAPLMLPVYLAIALIYWQHTRRQWRAWLGSMACLTLPYLPLVIWQLPLLVNDYDSGHPFYPLREQTYLLLKLYSSGLVRFIGWSSIALSVFLLLVGLFLPAKPVGRLSRQRWLLAAWLLLPFWTIYLISLRVPVFEDRYLIYITPAFYLLLALGVELMSRYSRLLAATALALVLAVNLAGIWQQQRSPIKADFRAAGAYLATRQPPPDNIIIQTPYLRPTFDYYYRRPYRFLAGMWTNHDQTEADVDREMRQLTAGLTEVWLVVSEESLWDSRAMVRTWLDNNAFKADEAHFMRVDVYLYRLTPGSINSPSMGLD
ncbi:MAG: hypothetical protein Kow0031_30970 [Anaerolineae bacterium]